MVVKMDTCTQLTEGTEKSASGPKGSEAINMRSRLRSRNNAGNNTSESSTTSNAAGNSTRKNSKRTNPSTGVTDATVKSSSPCSDASSRCDVTEESICKSGWPLILDYCKDECKRMLREYELCAYEQIVRVFRAQGNLTEEKRKFLHGLQQMLSISIERHQGEIRRATFDETLVTIAKQLNCQDESIVDTDVTSGWIEEGRRLISLLPRLVPQTAFHTLANHVAVNQVNRNNAMPLPGQTGNPSRLLDNFSSQVASISPKKSRIDSVSSTSLMMKNNGSSSLANNFKSPPNSQGSTANAPSSKSKSGKKLPVTKVPSVAKATVTTNSGITTTHLAVVRKSVNNLIRQQNSPCKSMSNCESSIESLVTNYNSPSKAKNTIDFNTTTSGHSNVGRVIFVPSSKSCTSSSPCSQETKPTRLIKSSQTPTLISLADNVAACSRDLSSSLSTSSSTSTVKVVPVSSVTSPLKKGQSITVIPSSSSQRINLLANSNGRMSTAACNGILSASNASSSLPGKGVIIQTYARSAGGSTNSSKKANLIIVPSSNSFSTPLSTKGSISVSNASSSSSSCSSSIIGKVVLPSSSVIQVPSSTGIKRPLVTNDTDLSNKKARILQTGKDAPKVITLQPNNKTSSSPMSGRMIDVPGLTAEAVESLINGKVTPEIMKLVQSAVSASLAKDQGNSNNKQQVITCLSSSKVVTSPTNCLTSTIAISKISSQATNKEPTRATTLDHPPPPPPSETANIEKPQNQVDEKQVDQVAPEKQPSAVTVQEECPSDSLLIAAKDKRLTEPADQISSPLKSEETAVLVKREDLPHPPVEPMQVEKVIEKEVTPPPEPCESETSASRSVDKIEEPTGEVKKVEATELQKGPSTEEAVSQPDENNQLDQTQSSDNPVHVELSDKLKDETKKDENTPIVPVTEPEVGCPRIQPIKLSRQGSSWVPFSFKSDESDASNSEEVSDEEDEEAMSIDQVEEDDEEEDESAGEVVTGEKDQEFMDDGSNESVPSESEMSQPTTDSLANRTNSLK